MSLPASPIFFLPHEVKAALIFLLRNAAQPCGGACPAELPQGRDRLGNKRFLTSVKIKLLYKINGFQTGHIIASTSARIRGYPSVNATLGHCPQSILAREFKSIDNANCCSLGVLPAQNVVKTRLFLSASSHLLNGFLFSDCFCGVFLNTVCALLLVVRDVMSSSLMLD